MNRILHNILRKKPKMRVTAETSALLIEMARTNKDDNPHKTSAKLIQAWLTSPQYSKQHKLNKK